MNRWLTRTLRRAVLGSFVLFLPLAAAGATITHLVDSMDSLYFTDWGHPYNVLPFSTNESSALGRGDPAEVVSNFSGAFNFAGAGTLEVTASGSNAISATISFGPDGSPPGIFRALTVYSLIGVWSESSTEIDPLGDAFFVGSAATLAVPAGPSAYLWLAFNDGIYDDNLDQPSPGFSVTLTTVPEPSSLVLLIAGLGLAVGVGRRRAADR